MTFLVNQTDNGDSELLLSLMDMLQVCPDLFWCIVDLLVLWYWAGTCHWCH